MAITNIPSAERLNDFALVLYYDAWSRLKDVHEAFNISYQGGAEAWPTEWEEYIAASSRDFETIINLAAQAAEIALKSKLCFVSPFLLLIGQGTSLKKTSSSLDFTDLRTLDAVDLPVVINAFCDRPLSDEFITDFDKLRRLRNKSVHLGAGSSSASAESAIGILVNLFSELWPSKKWLVEWVRTASSGRHSFFHDGDNGSPHAAVFDNLDVISGLLSKGQFKRLLGREKSQRKYYCFDCLEEGRLDWTDWESRENVKTAYLNQAGDQLECVMCDKIFPVVRQNCGDEECLGNVLESTESHTGYRCHTCCRCDD